MVDFYTARARHDGDAIAARLPARFGAARLPHHRSVRAPSARAGVGTDGGRDPRRARCSAAASARRSSSSRSGSTTSRRCAACSSASPPRATRNFIPVNHGNSWSLYTRDPEGNGARVRRRQPVVSSTSRAASSSISRSTTPRSCARPRTLCRATGDGEPYEAWRAEHRAPDRRRPGRAALRCARDARVEAPVLIVGAGPAGMTAALLLARLGIASRIVERRASPQSAPAAHVVNARTLRDPARRGRRHARRSPRRAQTPPTPGRCCWVTTLAGRGARPPPLRAPGRRRARVHADAAAQPLAAPPRADPARRSSAAAAGVDVALRARVGERRAGRRRA